MSHNCVEKEAGLKGFEEKWAPSRERLMPSMMECVNIGACLKVGGTHDAHTVSSEVIRTES